MAEFDLSADMFSVLNIPEEDRSGGPLGDNRRPILYLNPMRDFNKSTVVDEKWWQHHAQDIWHLVLVSTALKKVRCTGSEMNLETSFAENLFHSKTSIQTD